MKIGIISDTHGSLTAWQMAYENYFSDADLIIHCGDILYHGPRNPLPEGYNPVGLASVLNHLSQPILFSRGNCDAEVDQMLVEYPVESPYVHCFLPEARILAHHGHLFTSENLPPKIRGQYNLIISGHTHLPVIEQKSGMTWLNPGSPSLPKTEDKQPSVALLEGTKLTIINLHTGATIKEAHL